jgi:hypothetical protein
MTKQPSGKSQIKSNTNSCDTTPIFGDLTSPSIFGCGLGDITKVSRMSRSSLSSKKTMKPKKVIKINVQEIRKIKVDEMIKEHHDPNKLCW